MITCLWNHPVTSLEQMHNCTSLPAVQLCICAMHLCARGGHTLGASSDSLFGPTAQNPGSLPALCVVYVEPCVHRHSQPLGPLGQPKPNPDLG